MVDPEFQYFLSKKDEVLSNEALWKLMFRIHIILALIALLTDWFVSNRNLSIVRRYVQ